MLVELRQVGYPSLSNDCISPPFVEMENKGRCGISTAEVVCDQMILEMS